MLTAENYKDLVAGFTGRNIVADLPRKLVPLWCDDYYFTNPRAEVVLVDLDDSGTSFNYLFDIDLQRVIVAFGVPIYAKHKRDAGRMAGHPLGAGEGYHRGHLMAHSIGGGADINLVPQLGKLNIGEFRVIERKVRDLAKEGEQCLYFVRPLYANRKQVPSRLEQCVITPPRSITFVSHKNS